MESPSIPEHLKEFQPETAKFRRGYPSPVSPPPLAPSELRGCLTGILVGPLFALNLAS